MEDGIVTEGERYLHQLQKKLLIKLRKYENL